MHRVLHILLILSLIFPHPLFARSSRAKDPNRQLNKKNNLNLKWIRMGNGSSMDWSSVITDKPITESNAENNNSIKELEGSKNSSQIQGSGNNSQSTNLSMNENAKGGNPVDSKNQPFQSEGSGDGESKLIGIDRTWWIPLCFFIDPTSRDTNAARKAIKEVVDAFGKCDIAVEVHSTTIRPGTFPPDEPEAINSYANAHCNIPAYYGDSSLKFAAQTHPNSFKASDKMCDPPEKIKLKEEGKEPWEVSGCAVKTGTVSIVDKEGDGFTSTHEFGHNVGNSGQGGSPLENLGEHGVVKQSAGYALQLENSAEIPGATPPEGAEGGGSGGSFTALGCASLRGGANENSKKRIKWYPDAFKGYYTEKIPSQQLVFSDTKNPFLPPKKQIKESPKGESPPLRVVTNNEKPPMTQAKGVDPEKSTKLTRSNPPADPHKKPKEVVRSGDPKIDNLNLESGTSSEPGLTRDTAVKEPNNNLSPNTANFFGKPIGGSSDFMNENAGRGGSIGSGNSNSTASTSVEAAPPSTESKPNYSNPNRYSTVLNGSGSEERVIASEAGEESPDGLSYISKRKKKKAGPTSWKRNATPRTKQVGYQDIGVNFSESSEGD